MRQAPLASDGPDRRLGTAALSLAALLAPFFFLQWLTPFAGELVIGMDYPRIATPQQQELLFSLVHRSFPLFVPGFAGGQSAGALTAGQLYHPITYLAALLPGYWDGHALELMTLLRMLSLGAASLLLFRLLRRLVASELVAWLLASATVFNLRMLNVFHGASALEAFTGHLFTAVALAWCWLWPERRLPRLAVVAATYCTIASGHPQFAYFSLLGTLLAVLLIPALVQGARGLPAPGIGASARYWARMAALAALAGLLAAPYALQFQLDFMAENMRIGRSYDFSLRWGDTLAGALANFFQPLHSATAGAFGGSVLFLVAALAPAMALFGARPPRHVLLAWLAFAIVFLCSLGDLTPVHYLFWRCLPLFDSVRGPGRLTVVLPFLSLAILLWVFRAERPARGLAPLTGLALLALVATAVHRALPPEATRGLQDNTPAVFNSIGSSTERAYFGWGLAALAALACLGQARDRRLAAFAGVVLCAASAMQTRIALRHGVWTEVAQPSRTLDELRAERLARLGFAGDPGAGLYSTTIAKRLEQSCLDPFLARLYTKHESASDNDQAYALMDAGRPPDTLIAECSEPSDSDTPYAGSESVELVHASFNRVLFEVRAATPAWLELTFPYSHHWRARVAGAAAEIVRANGAYQAVRVPAGASTVEFRYVSRAAELGMLLACIGLAAGGAWLAWGALRGAPRAVLLVLIAALASGAFAAWRASLYTGAHLGTRYTWTPPPADARVNLAFQRPNRMSPFYPSTWSEDQALGRTPDPWGSGQGVDGLREPGRGFRTTVADDPHWIVDLAGAPLVGEVAVFGARLGPEPDARLAVELWNGTDWVRVAESAIDRDPQGGASAGVLQRFIFEPQGASRVRLQAIGTRALAADEVEVYGP